MYKVHIKKALMGGYEQEFDLLKDSDKKIVTITIELRKII